MIAGTGATPQRQAEVRRMRVGETVRLVREPDNPHDENAIAVITTGGVRLGLLPVSVAADVAIELDEGATADAHVYELLLSRPEFQFANIVLHVKISGSKLIPFSTHSVVKSPEAQRNSLLMNSLNQLKREDRVEEAERLLLEECDRQEQESETAGVGVTAWYYEQLAVIYARLGRYAEELAILQRYNRQVKEPGTGLKRLRARLERATVKNKLPSGYAVVAREPAEAPSSPALVTPSEISMPESVEQKGTGQDEADPA
jgi:hypothetical protein